MFLEANRLIVWYVARPNTAAMAVRFSCEVDSTAGPFSINDFEPGDEPMWADVYDECCILIDFAENHDMYCGVHYVYDYEIDYDDPGHIVYSDEQGFYVQAKHHVIEGKLGCLALRMERELLTA